MLLVDQSKCLLSAIIGKRDVNSSSITENKSDNNVGRIVCSGPPNRQSVNIAI